jgi:hypothetical protein
VKGIVYDAVTVGRLVGLGDPKPEDVPAVPKVKAGEIVIWSPGMSLQDVRDNPALQDQRVLWDDQHWYDQHGWSRQLVPASY